MPTKTVCAKIAPRPKNENPYTRKIGGPRLVCMKEHGHKGKCGDFEYMLQVEHARLNRHY